MKILILVRHAKSSWKDTSLPDHLRPLNKRGKRDGPAMGERLARRGVDADLVISSPTVRAMMTAKAFAREIGYPSAEIVADERLYEADASDLLEVIQELDDALECVLLFGHNPGLTDLANDLANDLAVDVANIPTCGIVELQFDTNTWTHIGELDPIQVDFDYPKKID